ncbi:hypothetical protein [Rhodococcus oryzae]|uniref:hypothetical protein n=1 Tax=Rhodococcus oryzae TaxID=2571143 RepID=UPI0037BA508C
MVAVVTVDLFGWLSSVDGLATTLSAIGRAVLGEDAEYGSIDQETVARLEAEWTSEIPHRIVETTSKQLWWALNNDDIESLRNALEPILAAQIPGPSDVEPLRRDLVAWAIHIHRYTARH